MSGLIMAGVAVAGQLLSSSQSDNAWKTQAANAGRNRAQVMASRARANALLPGKARAVAEAALAEDIQSQMDAEAARSEAKVQAAAAGVTGQNVTTVEQSIDDNAARVARQIARKRTAGMLQVNQDYEDNWWEAENNLYEVRHTGGSNGARNIAAAALAGVGAYFGNRNA